MLFQLYSGHAGMQLLGWLLVFCGLILMNDTDRRVQLLVDEDVLNSEYVGCHPCINTSSLRLRTEDLFGKVLKALGRDWITVRAE